MKRIAVTRSESGQLGTTAARDTGSWQHSPETRWHVAPLYDCRSNVGQEIWPDCSD